MFKMEGISLPRPEAFIFSLKIFENKKLFRVGVLACFRSGVDIWAVPIC